MTESADTLLREECPSCFGEWTAEIAIGDGWVPLVRTLCRYLVSMSDGQQPGVVRVLQVKEKFGGLRFYVDAPSEAESLVIGFAQTLSFTICESCGATDTVKVEGAWRKALCSECRDPH